MDNASLNRESLLELTRSSPEWVVDLILALFSEVQELKEKIKVLEARLDKDSHNSHKPPSSDGYRKPYPKSWRTPRERSPEDSRDIPETRCSGLRG